MADPVKRIERRSRRAIFQAYLENARSEKKDKVVVTDGDGRKLTHKDITQGAFALGGAIGRLTAKNERVGILLPTSAGAVIALFALLSRGRVPAMLNFTAGSKKRVVEASGLVAGLPTPNHSRFTMKLRSIAMDMARRTTPGGCSS
ncbi:AMP-binding protein [Hyphococcus sp.]|uniref:AMP-binding protein n=1 Tax=Hyphococcus sp. TaxID=2038636 RepID=UPI0035C68FFE